MKIAYDDFSIDEIVRKIKAEEIGAIVPFIRTAHGRSTHEKSR